jgi:hypothetical protein
MPYKIGDIVEVKRGGPRKSEFDKGEQVKVTQIVSDGAGVHHYKVDRIAEGPPLSRYVPAKHLVKRKNQIKQESSFMPSPKQLTVKGLHRKLGASKWDKSTKAGGHTGKPVPVVVQVGGQSYPIHAVTSRMDLVPAKGPGKPTREQEICVLVADRNEVL